MSARLQRLGLFSYIEPIGGADPYPAGLALYGLAEHLGYDTAWVATHHFGHVGGVPSPFVFLTALAERTARIGIGTAVATLSIDNALRVAEDAAVLETLHPGRLQLGLGTGHLSADEFRLFGRALEDRRTHYDTGVPLLLDALEGRSLTEGGTRLHPPAPGLRDRVWESPSTPEAARSVGVRGNGLLLSRVAVGHPFAPSAPIQLGLIDAYEEGIRSGGHRSRVVLSRTVVVLDDPARRASLAAEIADGYRGTWGSGAGGGHDDEDLVALSNAHVGTVDDVLASLSADPVLARADELIVQHQPAYPSRAEIERSFELLATAVAPALGWRREPVGAPR